MSSLPTPVDPAAVVFLIAWLCVAMAAVYLNWRIWQIYRRIGNYSIGLTTFMIQLQYPGINFPGPNVLEARIAAQPAELQDYIKVVRRRFRLFRRIGLWCFGFLVAAVVAFSISRKLGY